MGFGARLFLYETALGVGGFAIAFALGFWPGPRWWGELAAVYALVGALPVLFFAWLVTTSPASRLRPFREISGLFDDSAVGAFIRNGSVVMFAALSLCAGLVEEVLFRGIVHHYAGNVLTSVVFGLLHALTPAYFFIATGMSLYLGWVFETSGNLLAVPVAIHALYDFFALWLYRRKLTQISPPLHGWDNPGAPF